MADYKVVDAEQLDADLTVVADAIRSKGGTTEALEFPQGMASAVEAIQSGGEEFVGLIIKERVPASENQYELPRVVDMRKYPMPTLFYVGKNANLFVSMFANNNGNGNGGQWVFLRDVYLPDNLFALSLDMFKYCVKLENIYGDLTTVKQIQQNCFSNCKVFKNVPYMPVVNYIANKAFENCTALTEFKLYEIPTNGFSASSFTGCTNLLDIYVPWAEGEVANSPWGAVNSTIHYNTVYDENHNPIV